jgi:hypothetical protein
MNPEESTQDMTALDDARTELASLWSAPTEEHPGTYERIHHTMTEALSSIEGL